MDFDPKQERTNALLSRVDFSLMSIHCFVALTMYMELA